VSHAPDDQDDDDRADDRLALWGAHLLDQRLLRLLDQPLRRGAVGDLIDGVGQGDPGLFDLALDVVRATLGHAPVLSSASARSSVGHGHRVPFGVMTRLAPGDPAPHFALHDADGKTVALEDFRGRKVVVYFYPAAMTPGCTTQACDFRDSLDSLAAAGVAVLGVSPDKPEKLAKFRERDRLSFPLLSDLDHSTLAAYGAWGEKRMYGKKVTGVIRSTFVVGEDGTIAIAQYNVKASGHVAKLRRDLGVD
jgi:thioredoxin-dependent peroxiredoxin